MSTIDEGSSGIFRPIIGSWFESLKAPWKYQAEVLSRLVEGYRETGYGLTHNASEVQDVIDYQRNFPVVNYRALHQHLNNISEGNYQSFLSEPLLCWVMTRGSTGPAKVLPATKTHIEQILTCGARALLNHTLRHKDYELLDGKVLNLNFPSNVHTLVVNGRTMTYGYNSGTYAKLIPTLNNISLLPKQEDIDALGPGITKKDWERRFELAYEQTLNENVTATMGVTPVILSFARYINEKHERKPKQIWKLHGLFCTSVPKIQFKYAPVLKKYFGQVPVVEIYSATEGVFAQQLDDLPYVTPNYDTYFFEVETSKGVKMLHELNRGEWGSLIVSSCMLPRYRIGDLIESAGKNYFRIFGRDRASIRLEHRLYQLLFGWST